MRRVLRKCRNFLYQSVIKRMWKDHAFRFFIVEAIKHSNEYDLRIVSAQIASMSDGEQDFFRFIINHFTTSHSQSVQDLWALYEAKEARNKFFVEFGATDGVKINNTVLLEREYGWKGILAEPNPIWHEALFKNRSAAIETRCVHSATGHTLE